MFPDFVAELTLTWSKPLCTHATMPGNGHFLDLDGAEEAGLVNPPLMEASRAAYLALAQNHPNTAGSPRLSWRRFTGHRQQRPVH